MLKKKKKFNFFRKYLYCFSLLVRPYTNNPWDNLRTYSNNTWDNLRPYTNNTAYFLLRKNGCLHQDSNLVPEIHNKTYMELPHE